MNPWTRVNLVLAAFAVLLLVADLWPPAPGAQHPLTTLVEADIASIRVERAGRLELAMQRTAGGWQLTHPQQAPARLRRVQQLLAIARAPVQQAFAADRALAQYGLEQPTAVLHLNELRLAFGGRDPSQRSRYVLSEQVIRVIDELYFNLLTLPAAHFVEG